MPRFETKFRKCDNCGKVHVQTNQDLRCTCGKWISTSAATRARRMRQNEKRDN